MEKISKKDFCLLLAVRPNSVIGKEIEFKNGDFVKILDISLGGNYIFIGKYGPEATWVGIDTLEDEFIIDSSPNIPVKGDVIGMKKLDEIQEKILKSSRGGRR